MHGDIPQLHGIASHSKITDVHWTTISNRETGEEPVAVISFDNGSVVCFDQDGQQVKLLSDAIYGQNIIGNFDHFVH